MISKPFNLLQFLCLLLLSLLVSCEPPGEVQRYLTVSSPSSDLTPKISRFVRHSQPKPVNPIVKEILMEDNRYGLEVWLQGLTSGTDLETHQTFNFHMKYSAPAKLTSSSRPRQWRKWRSWTVTATTPGPSRSWWGSGWHSGTPSTAPGSTTTPTRTRAPGTSRRSWCTSH